MAETNRNQVLNKPSKRIIVAITGASGAIYGIRALEMLKKANIETHLILSPTAKVTIVQESTRKIRDVLALADFNYDSADFNVSIASGSESFDGMVVIPCSIKTLSGIANSYAENLIIRSADVIIKEGKPLILVVREAPLHRGHIRLMKLAAQAGAIIYPPVPAMYGNPQTIDDIINNTVGRILLRLGINNQSYSKWKS
jgi:4-hydroxy-3-polyprenylbenzoate decarboxylase